MSKAQEEKRMMDSLRIISKEKEQRMKIHTKQIRHGKMNLAEI